MGNNIKNYRTNYHNHTGMLFGLLHITLLKYPNGKNYNYFQQAACKNYLH